MHGLFKVKGKLSIYCTLIPWTLTSIFRKKMMVNQRWIARCNSISTQWPKIDVILNRLFIWILTSPICRRVNVDSPLGRNFDQTLILPRYRVSAGVTLQGLKALCLTLSLTVFLRSCYHIMVYGGHRLYSADFIKAHNYIQVPPNMFTKL